MINRVIIGTRLRDHYMIVLYFQQQHSYRLDDTWLTTDVIYCLPTRTDAMRIMPDDMHDDTRLTHRHHRAHRTQGQPVAATDTCTAVVSRRCTTSTTSLRLCDLDRTLVLES